MGIVIHSVQGYLLFWPKLITPSRLRQANYTKANYNKLTTVCQVSYELQCPSPALKWDGALVVGVHSLHVCARFAQRVGQWTVVELLSVVVSNTNQMLHVPQLKRDEPLVVGVHSLHVCARFLFRLTETTRCTNWLKLQ